MADDITITMETIEEYLDWLKGEERAVNTIEKYRRDLLGLYRWLEGRPLTRSLATQWKADLQTRYAASSVNSMLAAANGLFQWMKWTDFKLKFLKIQKKVFCDRKKELTRADYERLIAAARAQGKPRLVLLLETLCSLGLRVSELQYITVEAARAGRAEIRMKGKVRTVILPGKLNRKLLSYAREHQIESGKIFITRNGTGLSRSQIWQEMKKLSESAGVESARVFPPQSAPPVCPGLLSGLRRCGEAGGCAGPLVRGDHPHLSDLHRGGTRQTAGAAGAGVIKNIHNLHYGYFQREPFSVSSEVSCNTCSINVKKGRKKQNCHSPED